MRASGLTLLWIVGSLLSAGAAEPAGPIPGTVAADTLNLRSGPSENYQVVGQLKRGDAVQIRGRQGEWLCLEPTAQVFFWVSAPYVDKDGKVTATRVNVRPAPSTNHAAVGQVERGQMLRVLETKDGWSRVAPPAGCSVWVHRSLIEAEREVPALTMAAPTARKADRKRFTTPAHPAKGAMTGTGPRAADPAQAVYDRAIKAYHVEIGKDMADMNLAPIIKDLDSVTRGAQSRPLARRADFALKKAQRLADLHQGYAASMARVQSLLDTDAPRPKTATQGGPVATSPDPLPAVLKAAPVVAPAKEQPAAVGWVDDMGYTLGQAGTHKLVNGGKVYFLLRSRVHDLDAFVGKRVGVYGKVQKAAPGQEDVIQVERLEVIAK